MSDVEITLKLPEELVREARDLNLLTDLKIAELLQAEMNRQSGQSAQRPIESQLVEMASDLDIQRELRAIDRDFSAADFDGLDDTD